MPESWLQRLGRFQPRAKERARALPAPLQRGPHVAEGRGLERAQAPARGWGGPTGRLYTHGPRPCSASWNPVQNKADSAVSPAGRRAPQTQLLFYSLVRLLSIPHRPYSSRGHGAELLRHRRRPGLSTACGSPGIPASCAPTSLPPSIELTDNRRTDRWEKGHRSQHLRFPGRPSGS